MINYIDLRTIIRSPDIDEIGWLNGLYISAVIASLRDPSDKDDRFVVIGPSY